MSDAQPISGELYSRGYHDGQEAATAMIYNERLRSAELVRPALRAIGILALRRDDPLQPSEAWTEEHARRWLENVWGITGHLADMCILAGQT